MTHSFFSNAQQSKIRSSGMSLALFAVVALSGCQNPLHQCVVCYARDNSQHFALGDLVPATEFATGALASE